MFVSKQELNSALGQFKDKDQQKFYNEMCKLFKPLETPKPRDWLSGSKEAHQSFSNYRLPFYNPVAPERNIIYLQQFDLFDKHFIEQLCQFCKLFYKTLQVKFLPQVQFQKQLGVIRKRQGYYRNQYRAQDILDYMQKRVPNDAYCVMGITLQDIYPADSWLFAYGWAKYKARVGIFSFLRFDQLYARKQSDKIDWNVILYPSVRTMAHQIGHIFGVTHCVYYRCLMNGFSGIQENYSKPFQFCTICYRKISTNIRFDFVSRYVDLLNYCKDAKIQLLKNDIKTFEQLLEVSRNYPFKMLPHVVEKQQIKKQIKYNPKPLQKQIEKKVVKPVCYSIKKQQTQKNQQIKSIKYQPLPKKQEISIKNTNRAASLYSKMKK